MKRQRLKWLVATFLMMGATGFAQQPQWNWSITPYAWLAGMDGDTGVGAMVAPVDLSPGDVISNLDIAAMMGVDVNNGTWGVLSDFFYVDLSDNANTPVGRIHADVEQWVINVAPYYRAIAQDNLVLDVGVGGRYMDTDVDISTPAGKITGTENWIDPLIIARVEVPVAERCYVGLTGDIGGFGAASDLTWRLGLTAGYSITEKIDVLVGYRHMDTDYEDNGLVYDVANSGFGAGLKVSF
jgi:hypothetical protein